MNKKYTTLYAVLFLFFILPAQAQGQYFTVYGQVFDTDNTTPVNGVTVSLSVSGDTISTITTTATLDNGTNVDGIYYLDLGNLPVSVSAGTLMNLTATTTGKSASQTVARAATEPQRIDLYLSTGAPTFNIAGYKINDINGNGVWDAGEQGIQGWNMTLRNATTGEEIEHTSTNGAGFYQLLNLPPGKYNVTEETRSGWINTNTTFKVVNLTSQNIINLNFTNSNAISNAIRGDVNRNGRRDTGDVTLILRYIVGLSVPSQYQPVLPVGDMNCNNRIDTGDATLVLRDIVSLPIPRCWG